MQKIKIKYVDFLPFLDSMEENTLYISEKFLTASHRCMCGCGNEVITPLKKGMWSLDLDENNRVSLYPSIGNWNFECKSHYFIRKNKVEWSHKINQREIERLQRVEQLEIKKLYKKQGFFTKLFNYIKKTFLGGNK